MPPSTATVVPVTYPEKRSQMSAIAMSAMFWYCDSSKARDELGFQPRDPFETLRETIIDLQSRAKK